ncbi:uncharacterized protein LOC110875089 [Helianthus annuus]|uniref:uncharacterized protein LOC110875089 n=1 Tax=Helianthus annuus TaxID=4232 RepID=UPI001652EA55|nr:uncharacterized protein LOC110875089 [Helianthus annuus]
MYRGSYSNKPNHVDVRNKKRSAASDDLLKKASGNDRGNGNGKRMKNDLSAKASGNDRGDGDGKRMKNDVSAKASGNDQGNGDGKQMKNDVSAKDRGRADKTPEMIDGERCGDATTKKNATCGDIGNKENEAKDQETITTTNKNNETQNMQGLFDAPTFHLLTQDTELGDDVDDTHDKNQEGKGTAEKDITRNPWIKEIESRRRKPVGRFAGSRDDHEDEMGIDITTEEQRIWDFLFDVKYSVTRGMVISLSSGVTKKFGQSAGDVIFESIYGLELTKTLMRTLRGEVKVCSDVVDAWVDVMNFEELDRTDGCPTRVYFNTTVIDSWLLTDSTCDDDERMQTFGERMVIGGAYDFIGIKMGFFPILENDEYYMLVFDLENGEITVIDHKPDRTPLAGIRDHQDYYKKDTPYKVKHMLDNYLEHCKHPLKDKIAPAKIKRCDIHWATSAHPMDSAVFLMHHMQNFNGVGKHFECGFSSNWKQKQKQILTLRKKFATRILLCDVNVVKAKVRDAALSV